jgi:hypothetical protein
MPLERAAVSVPVLTARLHEARGSRGRPRAPSPRRGHQRRQSPGESDSTLGSRQRRLTDTHRGSAAGQAVSDCHDACWFPDCGARHSSRAGIPVAAFVARIFPIWGRLDIRAPRSGDLCHEPTWSEHQLPESQRREHFRTEHAPTVSASEGERRANSFRPGTSRPTCRKHLTRFRETGRLTSRPHVKCAPCSTTLPAARSSAGCVTSQATDVRIAHVPVSGDVKKPRAITSKTGTSPRSARSSAARPVLRSG